MKTITQTEYTQPRGGRVTTVLIDGRPIEKPRPADTHGEGMAALAKERFRKSPPPKVRRHWDGDAGELEEIERAE